MVRGSELRICCRGDRGGRTKVLQFLVRHGERRRGKKNLFSGGGAGEKKAEKTGPSA